MSRYVPITLDKERRLRYSINALADLEQITGQPIGALAFSGNVGINTLRAFLWAGLRHETRNLSVTDAGVLLQNFIDDGHTFEELSAKILEALQASGLIANEKDKKEEEEQGNALVETSEV